MTPEVTEPIYRPRLEISGKDREKIEKAARLTRRTPNKFIEQSAVDCAAKIIQNHKEAGVEEAFHS